jgi:hypothetical protein
VETLCEGGSGLVAWLTERRVAAAVRWSREVRLAGAVLLDLLKRRER